MNIKQYPLLQHIIEKYTYIYNSEGLIIFDFIGYYSELICLTTFVHSRLCEGTDEGPIFIRKVWVQKKEHRYLLRSWLHNTKSSLYLLKYVLETFTFS